MNRSIGDNTELLDELSRDKAIDLVPVSVYVAIMMVTGLFGNILVCVFYGKKSQVTPTTRLIVAVALIDTLICILMPKNIVDLCLSYKFTSSALCKLNNFVNHTTAISSAVTLIAIAAFRFRAVCKPLAGQFTVRHANISILIAFVFAVLVSIPVLVTHESVAINITVNSTLTIVGYDCNTSKAPSRKPLNLAVNVLHFFIFISVTVTLFVLYGKMGVKIMRYYRRKKLIFKNASSTNVTSDVTSKSVVDSGIDSCTCDQEKHYDTSDERSEDTNADHGVDAVDKSTESTRVTEFNNAESDLDESPEDYKSEELDGVAKRNILRCSQNNIDCKTQVCEYKLETIDPSYGIEKDNSEDEKWTKNTIVHFENEKPETKDQLKLPKSKIDKKETTTIPLVAIKQTLMLSIITLIFCVSFLPYIVMNTSRSLSKNKDGNDDFTNWIQFCTRSYLINSAANPFVYGFFNTEFRNFVKRIFCHCCNKCF